MIHFTSITKRHKKVAVAFIGISLVVSQLATSTVQAIDINFYLSNDVTHYDSEYREDCTTSNGISVTGSVTAEKIFNFFVSTPLKTNDNKALNAVQAAAFVGNFMQEAGPDLDPAETNSIGAFGLAQWLGGRKAELNALAAQQNLPPSDLTVQLAFIKQELEGKESAVILNPAFRAGTDIDAATVAIRKIYERPGEAEAMDNLRIKNAKEIYEKYKGSAPASSTSDTSSQSSGCSTAGVHQGDIIKTALGLAWDKPVAEGKSTKSDATKEYVAAIAQYGKIINETDGIAPFSDCGRFVSTVMRSSGVDPNYPLVDVYGAQKPYVTSNPDKYFTKDNPSMSDFQPGDIFISLTHTAIYVGNGEFDTVDASLTQRVPAVSDNMSSYVTTQQNTLLARFIGKES